MCTHLKTSCCELVELPSCIRKVSKRGRVVVESEARKGKCEVAAGEIDSVVSSSFPSPSLVHFNPRPSRYESMSEYLFFPSQPNLIPSKSILVGFKLPGIVLVVALVWQEKEDELEAALSRVWTVKEGPRLEILGNVGTEESGSATELENVEGNRIELNISSRGIPSQSALLPPLLFLVVRLPCLLD